MSLDQIHPSKQTKQMIISEVGKTPEMFYFANPAVLDADACRSIILNCPKIFKHFNNAKPEFGREASDEEKVRIRSLRRKLLSAIVEPLVYAAIANELKEDPAYLYEFQQHEIPADFVNIAIEADPVNVLGDLWDMGFDFKTEYCKVFLKNGLLIKYLPENSPAEAFYNAVQQNEQALFYVPDEHVFACIRKIKNGRDD